MNLADVVALAVLAILAVLLWGMVGIEATLLLPQVLVIIGLMSLTVVMGIATTASARRTR